ncbi:MAG: polysaccharide deacetylase family protein [Nitrosopumilales archaeon]|nr:polysaccharide deacetylase family protein [Nitrosopumilales archaeon]
MECYEWRIQALLVFTVVALSTVTSTAFFLPAISYSQLSPTPSSNNIANTKVVILSFDDNRKGDFTYAKPILDKYGFKATFFIICGKTTDKGAMNWQEIASMQSDGMDIESHTMTHKHLNHLSASALNFEIAGSKQCLASHGYNTTSFAYPYDEGADNVTVVNTVAKYYDLARTGSEPLMFLNCNGFKNHPQTDCKTYLPDGKLTYANRYAIRSLSFDRYEIKDLFNNASIFSDFGQILNSQSNYNKGNGIISLSGIGNNVGGAVPLITFHNVRPVNNVPYTTNVGVFAELMKYLHDNGYKVLDMANLRYDTKSNVFHIT